MITPEYVRLMAGYTRWQNRSLYAAAGGLPEEARRADRGAFFGSIHATLSHLLWGDQTWMHRLAGTPEPKIPDIPGSVGLHEEWAALREARETTDGWMADWSLRVDDDALRGELTWFSGAIGAEVTRPRWALVVQLFNHGTHHRGQVHAMLTAAGARPDDTDIQFVPDAHYPWP